MANEIVMLEKNEYGIKISQSREVKFYTFKGIPPVDLLRWIDDLNLIMDFAPLSDEQVFVIAKFIMYEFSTLRICDIEEAIFKSKAGKLKCNPKDYGKLSIDYFGRILSAYILERDHQNTIKEVPEDFNKKLTYYPVDAPKVAYEFIKKCYEVDKKEPYIAYWEFAFFYMEKNGIIKFEDGEKEMFASNVYYELKEVAESKKVKKVELKDEKINVRNVLHIKADEKEIESAAKIIKSKKLFQYECRKRMVKLYFESKL